MASIKTNFDRPSTPKRRNAGQLSNIDFPSNQQLRHMESVRQDFIRHALRQELAWLSKTSNHGPAHFHVMNLQGMLFRLRMSNDICFYAKVWRRICKHDALWKQIEILIRDMQSDWASRKTATAVGVRDAFPEKQAQRVRDEYYQEFYDEKEPLVDDKRRRRAPVRLGAVPAELPDGVSIANMAEPNPQRQEWFWKIIQLIPETFEASRRVAKAWAKSSGRNFRSKVFFAEDPEEDEFFLDVSRLLVSRVIPMRWFTMISKSQRDALLTRDSKCKIPFATWGEWNEAAQSFKDPSRPPGEIIDEGTRALIDAGFPESAERVLKSYLPGIQETAQDSPYVYQNLHLAYQDQGRPRLALNAAIQFRNAAQRSQDAELAFIAELGIMALRIQSSTNPAAAFEEQWNRLLPMAKSAKSPESRIRRYLNLSTECDRAQEPVAAERALSLAQHEAKGNIELTMMVIGHEELRFRNGGVAHNQTPPPKEPGLLGTPGTPWGTYAELTKKYYQVYPDERPASRPRINQERHSISESKEVK